MTILAVALAIGLLVLLISVVKLPPFVAFLIAALAAAMLLDLPLDRVAGSLTRGIADMLGSLIPSVARGSGMPIVYLAVPMLSGLSIAHGFLPPHPSPTALAAMLILGVARGTSLARLLTGSGEAVKDIAGILLIVAGAGALKQVFVDGGADVALAGWLSGLSLPPLVLGWGLAMVIRVALGSATVAGLTAAGIVQPLIAAHSVDPNLMVLVIGAGSLMFSHVNDSGFWMFKEYFGLSLAETFRSWSAMETLVGIFGLLSALLLSLVV